MKAVSSRLAWVVLLLSHSTIACGDELVLGGADAAALVAGIPAQAKCSGNAGAGAR